MFNLDENDNQVWSKFGLKKAVTVPFLIALSIMFVFLPLNLVSGQVGVSIINIVPPSQSGKAGDPVRILGSVSTSNSTYKIWFGNNLVVTNTSQGYYVDSSFVVPELPAGNYTITLSGVSQNINATQTFTVLAGYSIKALVPSPPAQLQEGSNVVLSVTLTGGQSSTTYYANITVVLPAPLNTNYSRLIELSTTQTGTAHAVVTYPDVAFQPLGSNTDFTGLYRAYFNLTQLLAEDQFFVGFTDASEYHRGQSVTIRAVGYQQNQDSTITITYAKTGANVHSETVTASSEGIINAVWTVPTTALVGDYTIAITPQGTSKSIVDSQLFTVPGYPVKIHTLNLVGKLVPQILVEALDRATNAIYNGTSGDDGIASVNLESGNHMLSAFWNDVKVGETKVFINGENTFDLACELINLEIAVQDKNGISIPFVSLDITYQYVTTKEGATKNGSASGQTGISRTFSLNSTLPGISYTINASLYGVVFNTNNTVSDVPAQPTFQVIILCPSQILTLRILDYNLAAIPNARIELVEQTSGIFYAAVTDNAGTVTVEVTFGKYRLRIYANDILLSEVTVEVFSDTQTKIRCVFYNLQVSVIVVDYFRQPIPNANVMLRGPEEVPRSATTQTDGIATFGHVIGGNTQITVYLTGGENSYEAVNVQVEAPTTIEIKMGKYVLLGPFIVETSLLATLIIILATVILFFFMEVYVRKRFQPSKIES
jgi:hypothetical protein